MIVSPDAIFGSIYEMSGSLRSLGQQSVRTQTRHSKVCSLSQTDFPTLCKKKLRFKAQSCNGTKGCIRHITMIFDEILVLWET